MARIAGVDLPREKRAAIGLTYIFGVGRTRALQTLAATGIDPSTARSGQLSDEQVRTAAATSSTRRSRSRVTCAARWRRTSSARSRSARYQGIRHRRGLPVRGQRTHTNARTRKGPKRAVGGLKKKMKK